MNTIRRSSATALKLSVSFVFVGGLISLLVAAESPAYYFPDPSMYTNGSLRKVVLYGDTLYVAGNFSKVTGKNGTFSRYDIAAFDVTTGSVLPFTANTGSGNVRTLDIDGDKLYAGGSFSDVNGVPRSRLVAVDRFTGEVAASFRNNTEPIDGQVWALAVKHGTVYFGGSFTQIDGVARNYLAAVDSDSGRLVAAFNPSPCEPMNDSGKSPPGIWTIKFHPNNPEILFAGGNFTVIDGNDERPFLAALKTDGTPGPAFDGRVKSPVTDMDFSGNLLCAAVGGFSNRVIAFGIGTDPYIRYWKGQRAQGDAQAVAVAPEGYVYFGFHQGLYDTTDYYRLAVLDATDGTVFDNYPPTNSFFGVRALDINDNFLVAGGDFTRMNDLSQRYLAVFSRVPFERNKPMPLDAPFLTFPRNRTKGTAVDVDFHWEMVVRALTYDLQLATDSGFTKTVIDSTGIKNHSLPVTGLDRTSVYWWRVRARSATLESVWSEAWQFSTNPSDEYLPVIVAPVNGSVDQPVAVTLSWQSSGVAVSYVVQIADNPAFSIRRTVEFTTSDTFVAIPELLNGKRYHWRVRAETVGGATGWAEASFRTIIAKPGIPRGITPHDHARQVNRQPVIMWSCSRDAVRYRVQITTDSTFGHLVIDTAGVPDTAFVPPILAEDTRYFWRVVSLNAGGEALSTTLRFTTVFPSPSAPARLYPESGTVSECDTVRVAWEPCSPYVTRYQVVIAEDSAITEVLVDSMVSDTQCIVPGLSNLSVFWWEVRAFNESGWSGFSAKRKFATHFPVEWIKRFSVDRLSLFPSGGIVRYSIAEPCEVSMELYNLHGVPVWTSVRSQSSAGPFTEHVAAGRLPSGKYFLRFRAGDFVKKIPAMLVR
jgi:hypothetical protein